VYDRAASTIAGQRDRLANIVESETRFGMGCEFKQRRQHDVMDEDWGVSPITQRFRDKAWSQLGTSGSGNHFVEFGAFTVDAEQARELGLEAGEYLALLSHSGSRARARKSATITASAPWLVTMTCQRNSSTLRGCPSMTRTARNTGLR
jgi:tRNA-splicing ligase RtcB